MEMNFFTDINGAANIIGCSVPNVRLLIKREFNPLPNYKCTGKKVVYNKELFELPKELISSRRPKTIFVIKEVTKWAQNQ